MDSHHQLKAALLAHREQFNVRHSHLAPGELENLWNQELASTNSQVSSATPRNVSYPLVPQKRACDFGMEPPSKRTGLVGPLAAFRSLAGLTLEGAHGLYSTAVLSA